MDSQLWLKLFLKNLLCDVRRGIVVTATAGQQRGISLEIKLRGGDILFETPSPCLFVDIKK